MSRQRKSSNSSSNENDDVAVTQGEKVDLKRLEGTWYVVRTTLSLWRNKTNPAITYGFEDDVTMSDLVTYGNPQNPSRITGTDYEQQGLPNTFLWKGNQCLTFCVTSKWNLTDFDKDYTWAVSHFESTLFTDEGVDILYRKKVMDDNLESHIVERMKKDPVIAPFVSKLFTPKRTDV